MNEEMNKKIELLKKVSLRLSEKQEMKEKISRFIDLTPVTGNSTSRPIQQRSYSGLFTSFQSLRFMPALLILAVLVGGGVSFAAEGSLPGDTLYPIKLNVNEEVAAALDFSSEAKAKRQAALAEKRLEEAVTLAAEGKLTTEAKEQLALNFEKHAEKFEEHIEKVSTDKDSKTSAELSSEFEASLNAHETILNDIEGETEGSVKIAFRIGNKAKEVSGTRESFETKVKGESETNVRANAEGKMKAAENKIEEVRKFVALSSEADAYTGVDARAKTEVANDTAILPMSLSQTTELTASATATVKSKVEEKFQAAEEAFQEGRAKLEASLYGEAFALFQKAIRLSQEAKIVSNIESKLKASGEEKKSSNTEIKVKNRIEGKATTSQNLRSLMQFIGIGEEAKNDYLGVESDQPIGLPACKSDIEGHYKIAVKYVSSNYSGNTVIKESALIKGTCNNLNNASTEFKVVGAKSELIGILTVDGETLKVTFNAVSKPLLPDPTTLPIPSVTGTTSGTINTQGGSSGINTNTQVTNTVQVGI